MKSENTMCRSRSWFQSRSARSATLFSLALLLGAVAQERINAAPADWQLVFEHRARGKYEDVAFVDARRGWVVTSWGEVLHSGDGGVTWAVQATRLGPLRTVDFLDSTRGFAGTVAGILYATTDGGDTWRDVTAGLPRRAVGFCGMAHVGDTLHVVGRYLGAADYFVSRDAGETWHAANLEEHAMGLVDVVFLSASVGLIGGISRPQPPERFGGAIILRTTDGGRTWRPVFKNDVTRSFTWKLFPVSASVVYASLQSNDGTHRVLKTGDAGQTWQTLIVATQQGTNQALQGVGFIDEGTGWVGGFMRGMYGTVDSGRSWRHVPVAVSTLNQFAKAGNALVTAGSAGILRFESRSGPRPMSR